MLIERIGFTPIKGGRHMTHDLADLTEDGPLGDRIFCLVDRSRGRILRTAENPSLLRACARWEAGVLSVDLSGHTVEGVPSPSGETLNVDYWGRAAAVQSCTGPWAEAYSEYLGYDVVLCRSVTAGEVVYGASVTVVTTSSMSLLAQRLGREVERSRANGSDPPSWSQPATPRRTSRTPGSAAGCESARPPCGSGGVVPRCAVVDLDPVTGQKDAPVLRELAGYRLSRGEVNFGVDAVVTVAGGVHTGDQVELEND